MEFLLVGGSIIKYYFGGVYYARYSDRMQRGVEIGLRSVLFSKEK